MTDEKPRKRRGLLGFYVVACIALVVLLICFPIALTRYKVWKWERKALGGVPQHHDPYVSPQVSSSTKEAVRRLVELGPAALPALTRVTEAVSDPGKREIIEVVSEAARKDQGWLLELFARAARDPYYPTSAAAVGAAESLTGLDFAAMNHYAPSKPPVGIAEWHVVSRENFLTWWETEARDE